VNWLLFAIVLSESTTNGYITTSQNGFYTEEIIFEENLMRAHQIKPICQFKKFIGTLTLIGFHLVGGAVGVNGIVPTDENILVPFTGQPTTVWKQVGLCSDSAVQISPSWILSARHSACSPGRSFKRADGATEQVDFAPPTPANHALLSTWDLYLSRLARPLPYGGNFVPLLDGWYPGDAALPDAYCKGIEVLMAGIGNVQGIDKRLQVGWFSYGAMSDLSPRDANPLLPTAHPTVTPGDSGGGMFMFSPVKSTSSLMGLLHRPGTGSGSSNGFPPGVRAHIDAILADPEMNPSGERINWVTKSEYIESASFVRTKPPNLSDAGGFASDGFMPEFGLITQSNVMQLTARVPKPVSCESHSLRTKPYGYRIRMARADLPVGDDNQIRVTDYYSNPSSPDSSGGASINLTIPGTWPYDSDWYLTAVTLGQDAVTGIVKETSLSFDRILVRARHQAPSPLVRLDSRFVNLSEFGGEGWQFEVQPILQNEANVDGVLFRVNPQKLWHRVAKDAEFGYQFGLGSLYINNTDYDPPAGYQSGDEISITAWPYRGARLGAGVTLQLVVP
jgi:hypothetical protein